ncbi:MAG: hypothetical protein K9G40_01155 [Crocinitomicaceae bacterium]|nr:hypothetical protein [Crocinitomicaceae bacterium]MCF8433316.1 hypothetical protein [Crocinitomicaceae bacterium]
MKKFSLAALMFASMNISWCQKINYDILRDNPKMFVHLKGGVIMDGDFSSGNNRSGYYFNGSFNLGKRIAISGEFQKIQQKWDNVYKQSINLIQKNPQNFCGRGSFFFQSMEQKEEVVAKWKEEGVLENLFLRQGRNGAILIFKGIDEEKAKELMATLPLYKLKKSVEYFNLIKQF